MNLAVIENGIVENIIVAESIEIAEGITGKECVEYSVEDNPHIGFGWDGISFEQPPVPENVELTAEQIEEINGNN
jgi:hypothetical protein